MSRYVVGPLLYVLLAVGCGTSSHGNQDVPNSDGPGEADTQNSHTIPLQVRITLDGEPVAATRVVQGGHPATWMTNAEGVTQIELDLDVPR